MAIVDDRRRVLIREQESNTNQDAEQICKIYDGAFLLTVRCGLVYVYRTPSHRVILPSIKPQGTEALHKICTLRCSVGFRSQKTALWLGTTS